MQAGTDERNILYMSVLQKQQQYYAIQYLVGRDYAVTLETVMRQLLGYTYCRNACVLHSII